MTEGRTRRFLDVNAYTTLDVVDARVRAADWQQEAVGVVDVEVAEAEPEREPVAVTLSLELDGATLTELPQHATSVELSPADARTLASDLTDAAATVEGDS